MDNGPIASYTATASLGNVEKKSCLTSSLACLLIDLEGHNEYQITVQACSGEDGEHAAACGVRSPTLPGITTIDSQFKKDN